MKIIEKSGYQALPWVRYITQSGGTRPLVRQMTSVCLTSASETTSRVVSHTFYLVSLYLDYQLRTNV